MNKEEIVTHVKNRFNQKKVIKDQRKYTLDEHDRTLRYMLPLYQESSDSSGYVSPKSYARFDRQTFTSVLPFLARNFLMDTKLFPDYINFEPERTADTTERRKVARALTDIIGLVRQEGDWEKANRDAMEDLIRGECYLYHDLITSYDGDTLEKINYYHIPWEQVYPEYKSKDWIIVSNLTKYDYVSRYTQEQFDKVGAGITVVNDETLESYSNAVDQKKGEEIVQVVIYINPATKEFYEVHGAGKVMEELTGDKFPFKDERGRCFSPIGRRVFYEPMDGNYHGWGVYDLLIPLARTETTIINASLQTVINDADPTVMISTDGDPENERSRYMQHQADKQRGISMPFFVRNSAIGSRRDVQNLSQGNTTNLAESWKNIILDWATMYTRIDFRVLVNYAPTAEQQALRKQEQDKVNRSIIERNALTDKELAMQDIYLLKTRENDFNDLTIQMEIITEEGLTLEEADMLRDAQGNLPKEEVEIREVLGMVNDYRYQIDPRLEGALDDMSYQEVQALQQMYAMTMPATVAQEKVFSYIINKVSPAANVQYGDNVKPAQNVQAPQPLPEESMQAPQMPQIPA